MADTSTFNSLYREIRSRLGDLVGDGTADDLMYDVARLTDMANDIGYDHAVEQRKTFDAQIDATLARTADTDTACECDNTAEDRWHWSSCPLADTDEDDSDTDDESRSTSYDPYGLDGDVAGYLARVSADD